MNDDVEITRSWGTVEEAEQLTDVTLDVVEGGASIGWMWPVDRAAVLARWRSWQAAAGQGERFLLVARDRSTGQAVGTVQVVLAMPDNQPHRGDLCKMLVHRSAQRRGIGAALMRAAEDAARAAGKTLLVLDTLAGSDAERLYERLGWSRVGTIPDYALAPRGGLFATTYFYRRL